MPPEKISEKMAFPERLIISYRIILNSILRSGSGDDTWWTSLTSDEATVIELYAGRGASEQFHSEIKTDLDVERLPSGKFATNSLVLSLAGFVYNMLRIIGQFGLLGPDSPVRHPAKRRRIRTVMQEIMYLAGRLIRTGRSLKLRFGKHCPGFNAFRLLYQRFSTA